MKFTGLDKIRFINLCKNNKLNIWNITSENDYVIMCCDVASFYKMKKLRRKCNGSIKLLQRRGLLFQTIKYKKHIFFVVGIILFFVIAKIITLYVWNISFEGNYSHTDIELMNFLNKNKIDNGIRKSKIDCEEIEYLLRTNYDDITWVSAEVRGTRIFIHIKENFDTYIAKVEDKPYNIISNVDGMIDSIVTRSGTPKIKAGDEVKKGQLLVSGIIEIYGDSEELINYRLVNSDSDIYARTYIEYNDEFELKHIEKEYTDRKNSILQVDILDKAFYLSLFQRKFKNYDIVKDYKQLSITDNFYLPMGYSNISIKEYKNIYKIYTEDEARAIEESKIEFFMQKLNEKGIQIIENNVTIVIENEKCIATGNFLVVEKIGEVQYVDDTMLPKISSSESET